MTLYYSDWTSTVYETTGAAYARTPSDVLVLSDAVAKSFIWHSDWSSLAVAKTGEVYAKTFQRYALHDLLNIGQTLIHMILNDMGLSDSMTRQFFADRLMHDVVSLADQIARERGIPLADAEQLLDAVLRAVVYERLQPDDAGLSDVAIVVFTPPAATPYVIAHGTIFGGYNRRGRVRFPNEGRGGRLGPGAHRAPRRGW